MSDLIPSLLASMMVMALAMSALAFGTRRRRRPGEHPGGLAAAGSRAASDPGCGGCAGPCDADRPGPASVPAPLPGRRDR